MDDSLSNASFIDSNDRNSAGHGFECHHAEVLVSGDEYRGNGSGDILREFVVVRECEEGDIGISIRHIHNLFFLGVVLSVDDEEFLIGHFPECLDGTADTFE